MARIEIYDDWGKLAETLEIVSADAGDLRRAIEFQFVAESDIHQCVGCGIYDEETKMVWNDQFRCAACDADHKAEGESNGS